MHAEFNDFPQHKSLNIIQAVNNQLYTTHLKHNNYISPFSASIQEKLNKNDEPIFSQLSLKKTKLQLSNPYPISEPIHWKIAPDQNLELPKQKAEFNKKLGMYRQYYKKHKNQVNLEMLRKTKRFINLPHYLIDLVNYGDKNPYFNGSYDWFCTRGNLTQIDINNQPCLVSVQGYNIISTSICNGDSQTLDIMSYSPSPIYSIQGYSFNNQSYLTLRSKNEIQIERLQHAQRSPKISNETIHKYNVPKKKPPFIDCVLLTEHKLITADVLQEVNFFDIETNRIWQTHKFDNVNGSASEGNLCQLQPITSFLLFMSRSKLILYDIRSGNAESEKLIKNGFFTCNDLCVLCLSTLNDNFVYIASKHNIYKCDLREMEVVKQWPHYLDNSPIVIKTLQNDNDEFVFVSSFTETICLQVTNGNHLPFKLQQIRDIYTQLQLKHEFRLREDIEERFKLSMNGLEVNKSHLYTSNSIGDVFKYNFFVDNEDGIEFNEQAHRKLESFINEVPVKANPLKPTHFKEMTAMKHVICKPEEDTDSKLLLYLEPNKYLHKFLQPVKKFGHYDMAKIWGDSRVDIGSSLEIDEPIDRIDTWLAHSTAIDFEQESDDDMLKDIVK